MATPAEIIQDLVSAHGLTEEGIAAELKKLGVIVSQATINRLKTGAHKTTKFEIGMGLIQLKSLYPSRRHRAA